MKKIFFSLLCLVMCFSMAACSMPGGGSTGGTAVCQHRDVNDDSLCDKCSASYTDGKDLPDEPVCQHRDANDDTACDSCGGYYEDGKDLLDAPVCQHRDADDNGKCDKCGVAYTDGKDIPDAPVCQHRDANDDEICDECNEPYTDGKDIPDAPVCQHRDADDNGKCDKCGGAYIDGKDIPDPPVCLHSDADKDHVCDYGCAIPFGSHEDQNLDHVCDYGCSVEDFGDHEDLDKDHVCDYGCMERIGKCEDTNEDDLCDYGCGKSFAPAYTRDGDYIYFGEYPQTLKADDVTITETQDSRGYYLGSDGYYYAKVTATPNWDKYTFSTGATVSSGSVYYFKVEPIRWRILSESNGTALILCDSIIANQRYDDSYNNYAESEIRAWLNEQFYETAFSELQKEVILVTEVDNSVYSTGYSSNPYACEDTEDKIFLLSYREVTNSAYGFATSSTHDTARRMLTSDYARAIGVWMSTSESYYGNGYWWLRSPSSNNSDYARGVLSGGDADYDDSVGFSNGVVPALQIWL